MVFAVIYFFLLCSLLGVQLYLWWLIPDSDGIIGKYISSETYQLEERLPTVSILIPVCNEESSITNCLRSLVDQNYPSSLLQIIVINDHSTDQTVDLVGKFSNVELVHQLEGIRGKKAALTHGIHKATGQVILTMDGDCEVGSNWIATMLEEMDGDSQVLVTGPVWMVADGSGFLQKYQEMEQAALNLLTYSGLKSGIFLSTIGANMGYYKTLFEENDPYQDNQQIPSGDDVFFAQKVHQSGGKVRFVMDREAIVFTHSLARLSDFIRQRMRWSSKSKDYNHWPTKLYLGSFAAMNLSFVVVLIAGIWHPVYFSYLFYGIVLKFIVDYLIISTSMRWGGRTVCWQDVLKASLFQIGYVVYITILVFFGENGGWKR